MIYYLNHIILYNVFLYFLCQPHLHSFRIFCLVIIPFKRLHRLVLDDGECVDDVRAQTRVDVVRRELAFVRPVLGPVREVAHTFVGG